MSVSWLDGYLVVGRSVSYNAALHGVSLILGDV